MQIERAPHHPDDDDDDDFFPLTRRHTQMRQLPFAFIPSRSADAQKKQKKKRFLLFCFVSIFPTAEFTDGPTLQVHWLPAFVFTSAVFFFGIEKLIFLLFLRRPFLF